MHTHSAYRDGAREQRDADPGVPITWSPVAGGDSIRCAPYATFGTQALSDAAVAALDGRRACLLANHGVIALGSDPRDAARLAEEVEQLARQYCIALSVGHPNTLGPEEMADVLEKFRTYGQRTE